MNECHSFTVRDQEVNTPQLQFHHRGTVVSRQPMPAELNHYRCPKASGHFQEVQNCETLIRDPPASREESIQ